MAFSPISASALPRTPGPVTPGPSSPISSPSGSSDSSPSGSPLRESPLRLKISNKFKDMISNQSELFQVLIKNNFTITDDNAKKLLTNITQLQQETLAAFDTLDAQTREAEEKATHHQKAAQSFEHTSNTFRENFTKMEALHNEVNQKHTTVLQELVDTRNLLNTTSTQLESTKTALEEKEKLLATEQDKSSKLSESVKQAQDSEKVLLSSYDRAQKSIADLEASLKAKAALVETLENQLKNALQETGKARIDLAALQKEKAELNREKSEPSKKPKSEPKLASAALPQAPMPPLISPREQQLKTWKKVAFVALAVLVVISLGAAAYFIFPALLAASLAAVSQIWKYVLALASRIQQAPLVNPSIYALRGRLGV